MTLQSKSLDAARFQEANPINTNAWFGAYQLYYLKYKPHNMYNMDETRFALRSTQSTCIIVDSTQRVYQKSSPGRQE